MPVIQHAQLMNHFIESPEIVMFEGSEAEFVLRKLG